MTVEPENTENVEVEEEEFEDSLPDMENVELEADYFIEDENNVLVEDFEDELPELQQKVELEDDEEVELEEFNPEESEDNFVEVDEEATPENENETENEKKLALNLCSPPKNGDNCLAWKASVSFSSSTLQNENKECWNSACLRGGPCSFCGTGSCCRKGWKAGVGCSGVNGCNGYHCCVHPGKDRM